MIYYRPRQFFIIKSSMEKITWQDFERVELIIGTVLKAEDFPQAKKPAYILTIDLGPEVGTKKSSAQITHLHTKEELIGKQVLCVCNFPPKQIGPFWSEVLTCGFYLPTGEVVLAMPERTVPNGSRLA